MLGSEAFGMREGRAFSFVVDMMDTRVDEAMLDDDVPIE
jgi:hypothetical protein